MAASGGDTVVPTNWSGLIMVAVVIMVIATATYFGMDMKFGSSDAPAETEQSLSVKDVFSASARREIAAAEPARVLSRAELAASAPVEDSYAADSADASAATSADDDWSSDMDSWDTQSDDWDSLESEEQKSDSESGQAVAAQQVVTPEPTPAPAKPTPKPSPEPSTQPRAQAELKPVATPATPPKAAAAAAARQAPSADALTAWWKDAAGDLSIRFAGTLDKGGQVSDGIAVMFSEPVAPAQGQQHMQLRDADGNTVSGQWKAAANPALLIFEGLEPGRYSLSIKQSIQGRNGNSLADDASGTVYVY